MTKYQCVTCAYEDEDVLSTVCPECGSSLRPVVEEEEFPDEAV